ncbi:branched-chain-amino-acid aminotransferase, cytosolic-like isoform X3 [Lasioglossum baleicum]|uniref:branched-chain-amino-acid aminotransferase, cytosolic-like isoform X3 n=1 Tax=Lasioglossum baleicum TaxID=434251 RepID=UPI003FCD7307
MVHIRRQILSCRNLLNQFQSNVKCSSHLQIRDKQVIQPERSFKYADLSVRLAGPQQLQPKPDVSALAFGKYFTDHMLKIFYHEALGGWQVPEITPLENLVLHPASKVLHYAIEPTLGVASSESALLYVILSPVGTYFKKTGDKVGISLLADPQYTRAWPGGCGNYKVGSNYGPTIHVQKEAVRRGLQQVLWLYGEDNEVTEAGTMNVFMFYINDDGEKELVTPPLSSGLILPGVTRYSILALAREWNQFKVTERKFGMNEVCQLLSENRLLELFGAGTACVVSPVSYIEFVGRPLHIPTLEHEEPVFQKFLKHLLDIQYGVMPDHPWTISIE